MRSARATSQWLSRLGMAGKLGAQRDTPRALARAIAPAADAWRAISAMSALRRSRCTISGSANTGGCMKRLAFVTALVIGASPAYAQWWHPYYREPYRTDQSE